MFRWRMRSSGSVPSSRPDAVPCGGRGEVKYTAGMHTGRMIALDLARRLKIAGLRWDAARGDRFVVPDKGMDDDVFVISDMVVEVQSTPTGEILGFNGITEWALDSVQRDEVVWMPREQQLRDLLGARFVRLEAQEPGYVVVITSADGKQELREADGDAESAYARALLTIMAA